MEARVHQQSSFYTLMTALLWTDDTSSTAVSPRRFHHAQKTRPDQTPVRMYSHVQPAALCDSFAVDF